MMYLKSDLIYIKFKSPIFMFAAEFGSKKFDIFTSYMIGTHVGAVSHPLASVAPAVKISSAPQVGGQTPKQSSPSLSVPLALQSVASWQPLESTE